MRTSRFFPAIQNNTGNVCGNDIGLYRDDGLAAFNKPPREIEAIKKHICKVFGDHNLKLTIEANKKCVNFLDVTLDLRSTSYKPYMKPGNTPQYVNRQSNHPPSVLRRIPKQSIADCHIYLRISSPLKQHVHHTKMPCQRADTNLSFITTQKHQSKNAPGPEK